MPLPGDRNFSNQTGPLHSPSREGPIQPNATHLPPGWRAAGAPIPHPQGAKGRPPSPRRDRDAGGGGAAGPTHRAPQRLQPPAPAKVAADGRARTSAPERRADHARGRHAAAHQNSMGAAPPMTRASPVRPTMLPTRGGQREVSGLRGPPGEGPTGHPSSPPPPARQAAPGARGGPATRTEHARRGGMRRRREGGQGRGPRREPSPPPPPPARKPRGRRPSPPRVRGDDPPSPWQDGGARERGQSTARPPAPAASPHRNRGEQPNQRQRARAPHRLRPEKAGEHDPDGYRRHALHDQNNASDTRFVACPGKAEGRNEAE